MLVRRELLGQPLMRDVGLGDDQQARRVLVDPVDDARPRHAADARQLAAAMVEQRVDQGPVAIARGRMDDQSGRLVDDQQMLVLEDDRQRDVLRLVVRRRRLRHGEEKRSSPRTLVAGSRTALAVALRARRCGQRLQPLARQGRDGVGKRTVEPPARMAGVQRYFDVLMPPPLTGFGNAVCARSMIAQHLRCRLNSGPSTRRMNAVDLASLLCSRLCHDLMSPVGALNNGIELLGRRAGSRNARALPRTARRKRPGDGQQAQILPPGLWRRRRLRRRDRHAARRRPRWKGIFGAERRIELGWMVADDKLSKGAVKLLLNLALIAGDALVRGGRLDVGAETTRRGLEMVIRAEGPRDPARSRAARDDCSAARTTATSRAARGRRMAGA